VSARSHDAAREALRAFGLAYPEAHTKSPWPGHLDVAVRDKTFAYVNTTGEPLSVSCKLPQSSAVALMLPFAKPTGYGLGRAGWVTADFAWGEKPPVALLKQWIDESYRAQAPRRLVATLPPPGGGPPARRGGPRRASSAPPSRNARGRTPRT